MGFIITKSLTISLLDCDYAQVLNNVSYLLSIGVKSIHFDLMDGSFVKTISYGPKFVTDLMKSLNVKIDSSAHLMIKNAHMFIDNLLVNPPSRIVVHIEDYHSIRNIGKIYNLLAEKKVGLGLAINPKTKITKIDKGLLAIAKEILVMTVEPGLGGQKLMVDVLDKTIILNELKKMHQFDYTITIDGGVNATTIKEVSNYPIDQFVVGSYVWKDLKNAKENLSFLMNQLYRK